MRHDEGLPADGTGRRCHPGAGRAAGFLVLALAVAAAAAAYLLNPANHARNGARRAEMDMQKRSSSERSL